MEGRKISNPRILLKLPVRRVLQDCQIRPKRQESCPRTDSQIRNGALLQLGEFCGGLLFGRKTKAENYYVPEPPELGRNGSFGVFKMMRQDVVGFENFLLQERKSGSQESR
jgi:hypothetical protein